MTVQFPFLRLSSVLKPHCSKSNVVLVFCFSLTGIYSAVMYASDDDAHRAVRSGRHGLRYLMTAEFAFHTTTKLIENWSLKCLHVSLICYIITSGKRQMTRKATTMMTNANIEMTSTDCTVCGASIGECDGFCTALPNELDDCVVCGASIGECDGFCTALPNELDDASEF